jgi:hypothetical protein
MFASTNIGNLVGAMPSVSLIGKSSIAINASKIRNFADRYFFDG